MSHDQWALRNNEGITITRDVEKRFPAVFNDSRSKNTSSKYELFPSHEVIQHFTDQGLRLVELAQQRSHKRNPKHTAHIMRFQASELPTGFGINDSVPEIVIKNNHDGKGAFHAYLGIFRFVCSNGLVCADTLMGQISRRHFGEPNTFDKVMAVLDEMPRQVDAISKRILDWNGLELSMAQQAELARLIMEARPSIPSWAIERPELVLEAQRPQEAPAADGKRNLWLTMNVLQENLTTQRIERPEGVLVPTARQPGRASPIRPLRGAMGALTFNQALWGTAQAYFDAAVEGFTPDETEAFKKARKRFLDRSYKHDQRHGTQLQLA